MKPTTNIGKSKMTRYLCILVLGLLLTFSGNLQASATKTTSVDSTWTLDTTVNNVKCYYKIVSCNDHSSVLLLFDNQNNSNAVIKWNELFNTQVNSSEEGYLGQRELEITAGETSTSGCSTAEDFLIVNYDEVNPTYPAVISGFKFIKIEVTVK